MTEVLNNCFRSRLGRAFFLLSLLISTWCVGYLWSNMDSPYVGDVRKIFFTLHGFSILQIDVLYAWLGRPIASRFNDGVLALLFSIPWWFYGYGVEIAAAKIREMRGD